MISLIIAFSLQAPGQIPHVVTDSEIRASYRALIHVEAAAPPGTTDTMLMLAIDSPPPGHLLSGFYRRHEYWFSYLARNGRNFSLPGLDDVAPGVARASAGHASPDSLADHFATELSADSGFNALMVPTIASYLRHSGVRVAPSVPALTRRALPLDTLMPVTVRFFYPDLIIQGKIATHVCTVINAVRELPRRDLAVEAFAFGAIMRQVLRGDSSSIEPDFAAARALINTLDSPAPDSVRLRRAQGVMWGTMARSSQLRAALLAAAIRERDILPFTLRGH